MRQTGPAMDPSVERARAAFAQRAWSAAFAAFSATAEREELEAADQERLAVCAYLVGEDEACERAWEAAHRRAFEAGDVAASARYAFWLGLCLILTGSSMSRAGGWLARGGRLVEEGGLDCPAAGYLILPQFLGALEAGDAGAARDLAVRALEVGVRFDDPDLRALGILAHGQALIATGDFAGGTARLDEVMVSVTAGEVGPVTAGIVYCAVILQCLQVYDVARATEWTGALDRWCETQPDLVPYRGQCLVHRSQLQQAAGDWRHAITTAEAACRRLTDPPHPAVGLAHYQKAELHRLNGAFDDAEREYRLAGRHGHHPMPGLALLRLARGDAGAAADTIRRALEETVNPLGRPPLLSAAVDILRAAGDLPGARAAADELTAVAAGSSAPMLAAMAAQALGTVSVSEGDPAAGLAHLRAAATAWQTLRMPYEAARTAIQLGLGYAALGDRTSAAPEFDNSREILTQLGAAPDLDRLATLRRGLADQRSAPDPYGQGGATLSPREREVLGHVAEGKTNREIAVALVISQHTVARHLENIFAKLGVTTRAAAIARAYERHLL